MSCRRRALLNVPPRHASCSTVFRSLAMTSPRLQVRTLLLPLVALALSGVILPACSSSPAAYDLPDDQETEGLTSGGGAGGAGPLACGPTATAGGSCEPADPTNLCQACVEVECCAEQRACNSTEPETTCAFGSTLFDGSPVEGGEIACMMECFAARSEEGVLGATEDDVNACAELCAASECGAERASAATTELAGCILGVGAESGCAQQCGFLP